MDKAEAKQILASELGFLRPKPYAELRDMIGGTPIVKEVTSPKGNWYQIEIQAFWDSTPNGDVRVLGSIDDGGWRAFCPLCSSFIKNPHDMFVGE